MTEEMWLGTTDPARMFELVVKLNRKRRKWRLALTAACRQVSAAYPFSEEMCLDALEVAERFADGKASDNELHAAHERAERHRDVLTHWYENDPINDEYPSHSHARAEEAPFVNAVVNATLASDFLFGIGANDMQGVPAALTAVQRLFPRTGEQRGALTAVFREIFENPFRTVAFDPKWRTSDVMILANGAYSERAFDQLPILADALQDAGCASDDLLNHIRDTSVAHARGCWALDLVLGKG